MDRQMTKKAALTELELFDLMKKRIIFIKCAVCQKVVDMPFLVFSRDACDPGSSRRPFYWICNCGNRDQKNILVWYEDKS